MMSWTPITREEFDALISKQLGECDDDARRLLESIRVEPVQALFRRGSMIEPVFIAARFGAKVVFYDDVEEAFEIAPLDSDGVIDFNGVGRFELVGVIHQLKSGGR